MAAKLRGWFADYLLCPFAWRGGKRDQDGFLCVKLVRTKAFYGRVVLAPCTPALYGDKGWEPAEPMK